MCFGEHSGVAGIAISLREIHCLSKRCDILVAFYLMRIYYWVQFLEMHKLSDFLKPTNLFLWSTYRLPGEYEWKDIFRIIIDRFRKITSLVKVYQIWRGEKNGKMGRQSISVCRGPARLKFNLIAYINDISSPREQLLIRPSGEQILGERRCNA